MILVTWEKNPEDGKAPFVKIASLDIVYSWTGSFWVMGILFYSLDQYVCHKILKLNVPSLTERGRRSKRRREKHHNVFLTLLIGSYWIEKWWYR